MATTTSTSSSRRTAYEIAQDKALTKEAVSSMVLALHNLKTLMQEMNGFTASANAILYLILEAVYQQYITFLSETGGVASKEKHFREVLSEEAKVFDKNVKKESTFVILLVIAFGKEARYVKRYAAVLKKFEETRKDANEFLGWIEENGGIDGVLNYTKQKSSEGNDSKGKSANDPYYQAVTDDLVAGRSTPIKHIKTNNIKGEYALVLAQRIVEGEYALIGSVDNLVDDAAPEVERFKQMMITRKKDEKKAADAAAAEKKAADKAAAKAAKEAQKAGATQA